jgi:uncharacterized membrane-anchored protein
MSESADPMAERLRYIVLALTTLAILLLVNSQIIIKERILSEGDTLLLRLVPRDPRSLLLGDYMALRDTMADEVVQAAKAAVSMMGESSSLFKRPSK